MFDALFMGAFAHEDVVVTNAVKQLSAAAYKVSGEASVRKALVSVEENDCRFTLDGTDPNPAAAPKVGCLVKAGTILPLYGQGEIEKFKIIREGAADASIHVIYKR